MAFKFLDTHDLIAALQQQEATSRQRFQHLCDQLHEVLRRLPEAESAASPQSTSRSDDAREAPTAQPYVQPQMEPVQPQVSVDMHSDSVPSDSIPSDSVPSESMLSDSGEMDLAGLGPLMLGPRLAGDPALAAGCHALVDGLTAGDRSAMTFAGQLLLFRSAAAERYPQLLKDLGEAYYAWRKALADDDGRFEAALVAWLSQTCAAAGLANQIERVQPGDRFDPTRHQAPQSGVEVAEVCGWVVLRDNGKVYTRAAVTAR